MSATEIKLFDLLPSAAHHQNLWEKRGKTGSVGMDGKENNPQTQAIHGRPGVRAF